MLSAPQCGGPRHRPGPIFPNPVAYGFLGGFLWATLVRTARNHRIRTSLHLAPSEPSPSGPVPLRGLRRLLPLAYLCLFFLITIALCFGLENIRGSIALRSFYQELQARGEPTTLKQLVPPSIPDDQNLAEAPILKPLFAFERTDSGNRPVDSNALARTKSINREDRSRSFRAFASETGRKQRTFAEGQPTDLDMWQAYYQSLAHWPQAPAGTRRHHPDAGPVGPCRPQSL